MTNTISRFELALERGKKMFRDGKSRPACPEESENGKLTAAVCEWMGWGIELGMEFFRRRDVIRLVGDEEPDDLMDRILAERL
jgi:hypothetical protein